MDTAVGSGDMSAPLYLGDEVSAAGYRLAGARVHTPRTGEETTALAWARSHSPLVLVSAAVAAAIADTALRDALAQAYTPERTLAEVALDGAGVRGSVVRLPGGLDFLPGAAGVAEMADLPPVARQQLIAGLSALEADYDFILVDTAAGAGENVRDFLKAADLVVVVTTVDPTAVTDAYALAKMLVREGQAALGLVVNMARSEREGQALFERVAAVARRFAAAEIEYLGSVPFDWKAAAAVRERRPLLIGAPFAPASVAVRKLAARLAAFSRPEPAAMVESESRGAFRNGLTGLLRRAVGM